MLRRDTQVAKRKDFFHVAGTLNSPPGRKQTGGREGESWEEVPGDERTEHDRERLRNMRVSCEENKKR